jgi:hypothetical protein
VAEKSEFIDVNNWTAGTLFALSKDSLGKTYFRYSDPHNHLAVDRDSVQGITSEQSQLNEVHDLLDLLNGE